MNKKIVLIFILTLFVLCISAFYLISKIRLYSEQSIYLEHLGRGIGIDLIQNNQGIVDYQKIPNQYKIKSKYLGYTLIVKSGYKIINDGHQGRPWAFYIQTKNNFFQSLVREDISILAVYDDLSVYQISSDTFIQYIEILQEKEISHRGHFY